MALGGQGVKPQAAGEDLLGFLKANPNSFHYYEANELIGDLLMSVGKFKPALAFYKKLADSSSPDSKPAPICSSAGPCRPREISTAP